MVSLREPAQGARSCWTTFPWLLAAALFCLSTLAVSSMAGQISPPLRDELAKLSPQDQITVIFNLNQQANISVLNQALKLEHATRQERHRVVVEALQQVARTSQGPFLHELEARKLQGGISGYTPYWISNLVVVRGTRAAIEDLAARMDVDMVESNPKFSLDDPVSSQDGPRGIGVTPGLRAIHAPQVWYGLGVNGTGALVANLDTGVDGNHPALQARYRGNNGHPWQECWLDVLGTNTQYPNDSGRHGTHTMGTITGLGAATQDTIGVAWGAQWIACNAINQGVGTEFDNDVIHAFQWFADPDGNPNTVDDVPDVVSNSWRINEGFGGNYTDCDTRWWNAIDNCEAASVVIIFAAGNEGPGAQTIGSPPDRATTLYNVFSVGAVDATDFNWPYPIADWSSRGPTGCNVAPPLKIKPEVAAPGVNVYSSVPGGTYESGWSGTSMACPHVAGTVGLMRSANPDIDVDTIKQILIDTARDEGTSGEDNTYGNGFIDAYEAVIRSLTGYGTLSGNITNASNGGTPVPLANVKLLEINRSFVSNDQGAYSGMAPAGTYTVEVTHPSFTTVDVPGVVITAGQVTTQDFSLTDIAGPAISNVQYPHSVENPYDPLPIEATITDYSAIPTHEVVWRVDGGDWSPVTMDPQGNNVYQGVIPGQPIGATVDFYIRAVDVAGNQGLSPSDAPAHYYTIFVVEGFFTDDCETDKGWSLFQNGDTSTGRWVRMDPWGTTYQGQQVEPADDHTPDPGHICFVTGAGTQGGAPGQSDVDNGCVTLTTPVIDLSNAQSAILSYWRWFALIGPYMTGSFTASITSNGGITWTPLETLSTNANSWNQATFNLNGIISFTSQVQIRFVACDTGGDDLVEGAVDDFALEGVPGTVSVPSGVPATRTILFANQPNPFSRETTLRYQLAASTEATLSIYDPAGRLVRTVFSGRQDAGMHTAIWNGKDEAGRPVNAGVYFYELKAAGFNSQKKMLLIK